MLINKEDLIIRWLNLILYINLEYIHTITLQTKNKNRKYLNWKIWTSDFSSGPVDFSVTGPDGPVATNS